MDKWDIGWEGEGVRETERDGSGRRRWRGVGRSICVRQRCKGGEGRGREEMEKIRCEGVEEDEGRGKETEERTSWGG